MVDETAAAYGLFQVSFAWLEQELAAAIYHLRHLDDPKQFDGLLRDRFSDKIKYFKEELQQANLGVDGEEALARLKELSKWRNERTHARIEIISASGYQFALYSKTGHRLEMNPESLRARTNEVLTVIHLLNDVARLHRTATGISKELEELLGTFIEPSETTESE